MSQIIKIQVEIGNNETCANKCCFLDKDYGRCRLFKSNIYSTYDFNMGKIINYIRCDDCIDSFYNMEEKL